ncbi:MAG: cytochrome c [Phycisphaerales bacterium]
MRTISLALVGLTLVAGSCTSSHTRDDQAMHPARVSDAALPPGVFEVVPGVYSGPMPEGREGFETLAALGVRTVLSVDGARPDVEDAAACEIAYAQVPTQYAGITDDERDEIARALRDSPRPIYVHCHHGQHRGPAATATGMIALGEIDNAAGLELLEKAGTSASYPGLWAAVREARPLDSARIDAAPVAPPVATVSDYVAGMSAIDHAWDHLKACQDAGWAAPDDHPDLVPAAEAGIIADTFRQVMADPEVAGKPEDFHIWLREAQANATELERLIVAGAGRERIDEGLKALGASCKTCHAKYRD